MIKKPTIAFLAGLIALSFINSSIWKKEQLLRNGEIIFLKLAPVDPRSLMQGDYMALRFAMSNDIRNHLNKVSPEQSLVTQDGYVFVTLREDSVAVFSRIGKHQDPEPDERRMKYRIRNGQVKFATNAFFFQEGTARHYENARYGEFRLESSGELLLTGLRSETLETLGPRQQARD